MSHECNVLLWAIIDPVSQLSGSLAHCAQCGSVYPLLQLSVRKNTGERLEDPNLTFEFHESSSNVVSKFAEHQYGAASVIKPGASVLVTLAS